MDKVLKTNRLVIKSLSRADEKELSALLVNEEIKKTYMIPDFANDTALHKMLHLLIEYSASEAHFTRGIYRQGRLIGFVNDVEIKDGCAELGYVIHPAYWGNGYATEMLREVIDALLGTRFDVIRAGAFRENGASIRVMEKCGMQRMSILESIEYRGVHHECIYYEIKV